MSIIEKEKSINCVFYVSFHNLPHSRFKNERKILAFLRPLNIQGKSGFDSDRVKLSLAQIAEGF